MNHNEGSQTFCEDCEVYSSTFGHSVLHRRLSKAVRGDEKVSSSLPLTSPQFPFSCEMILHHTQSNVSFSQLLHKNVPLCSNGLTATYFADEFADSIGELGQSLGVFSVLGLYLFFLKA